jgi:hypothetical protein
MAQIRLLQEGHFHMASNAAVQARPREARTSPGSLLERAARKMEHAIEKDGT